MNKLLHAEFSRLFHSILFWLCIAASNLLGIGLVGLRYVDIIYHPELYKYVPISYTSVDDLLFVSGLYLIFAFATFIGIFQGTEYSDGTLRNKIIMGHKRSHILLSKWIVCCTACSLYHLIYIFRVLLSGFFLLNGTTLGIKLILTQTLITLCAVLAFTTILLLCTMIAQNKAIGAVTCLLITVLMLYFALRIDQKLRAPEYYEAYTFVDEESGDAIYVPREKNPKYLTGTKRQIYSVLNDVLPVSQLYRVAIADSTVTPVLMLYDGITVFLVAGFCMILFSRKDLK